MSIVFGVNLYKNPISLFLGVVYFVQSFKHPSYVAMFSVMPAMYLLLQSNENSSLKLIAWLIKLNTGLKNSIISAAHDYLEFSQTTGRDVRRASSQCIKRAEYTHLQIFCCDTRDMHL